MLGYKRSQLWQRHDGNMPLDDRKVDPKLTSSQPDDGGNRKPATEVSLPFWTCPLGDIPEQAAPLSGAPTLPLAKSDNSEDTQKLMKVKEQQQRLAVTFGKR